MAFLITACFLVTFQFYFKENECSKIDFDAVIYKKADDIINERLGDVHELKQKISQNRQKSELQMVAAQEAFQNDESIFDFTETTTTETNEIKLTTLKMDNNNYNESVAKLYEHFKSKMRTEEVNILLRGSRTLMPNFANNDDDPNVLTRRYDLTVPSSNHSSRESRRVIYDPNSDDPIRMRNEKIRLLAIMVQFIYMTRRQMGYMSVLRNKYKDILRYQIGYTFGLLRMVRLQQQSLFKNIRYHLQFHFNANIHLQFYYRIVMLNVDVNDLLRFIQKLNFKYNLLMNPRYYFDSSEYYGLVKGPGKSLGSGDPATSP